LICGGRRSPSVILGNQLIKLLPEDSYETQSVSELGEIPPKVYRHLFLKLNESNKIVQLGGKQSFANNQTDYYYILDTNTMRWQQRVINIPTNIYSHSGVSINPYVMIINGGLNCDTNSYHSNDIYLIDDRTRIANNINVKGLDHLYSHNIKCFNENKVVIIGGIAKSGTNNKIDLIDLRFNQIVDSMDIITESSLMLHNFSSELIMRENSSFLWLIGGGGNCFSFGTHFNKPSVIELFIK
jgi:tRNA wybutosine-synthesizing protein 4